MSDEKRIIEVNGVKIECDMRTAKTVESYRVGDSVKVPVKEYGSDYACYPGVIIGFAEFQSKSAIEVMYLSSRYNDAEIKVKTLTTESKDIEIVPSNIYETKFDRAMVLDKFDRQISKKEEELRNLLSQREAFEKFFGVVLEDQDNDTDI